MTAYLTLEQILVIHDMQIEEFGGSDGLRDLGLLESAVMRPQGSFGGEDLYKTLFEKAAALAHSLVLNHPFVDGNKRTGIVSAVVFLELNGFELKSSQKELVSVVMKLESKEWGIVEISKWLRRYSKKK